MDPSVHTHIFFFCSCTEALQSFSRLKAVAQSPLKFSPITAHHITSESNTLCICLPPYWLPVSPGLKGPLKNSKSFTWVISCTQLTRALSTAICMADHNFGWSQESQFGVVVNRGVDFHIAQERGWGRGIGIPSYITGKNQWHHLWMWGHEELGWNSPEI